MRPLVPLSLLVMLVSGCASTPRDDAFDEVGRAAAARTGARIHWKTGGAADRQVAEHVRTLMSRQLSDDDAVQLALLNNPRLQARYEELGIAQADLVAAGLLKNPIFDGFVRWPDDGSGPNVELAVTASFLDVLFIPLRKRVAAAQFERVKLETADAVVELATQVRRAFYELNASQQMLEMRRTVLEAEEAAAQTARRMFDVGNINQLDADSEAALYEQARLEVIQAEADAAMARQTLATLMGMAEHAEHIQIAQRLPELPGDDEPVDQLVKRAANDRLDLAAAQREIDALRASLGLSRAQRYGGDEAEIGVNTEREPGGQRVTGPAFSIPIPLFDFGRTRVARARHELRAAEHRYNALQDEVRSEVRLAQQQMLAARQRAEHQRTVVLPLRRRIVEQAQRHYNAMLLGVFQLLEAKEAEIDAGRVYLEALRDYWVARAELERAVGGQLRKAPPATRPATAPMTQPGAPATQPAAPAPQPAPDHSKHHHH